VTAEGGAALLWGLGLMITVAGRLRQSLNDVRRGAAHSRHGVRHVLLRRRALHRLKPLLWGLGVLAIGVGVGLAVTLL